MLKRLCYALPLIFMIVIALPPVSAQEITQVDLIDIPGVNPSHMFPAPDGHQVAYQREHEDSREFCVYNALSDEETCIDLDRNFPGGLKPREFFPPLQWSPDSTKIAIVGLPLMYFKDCDLWIFDVQAGTLTNIADDQYEGALFPDAQPGASAFSQPTWSPDSTQIAVEYTVINEEGRFGPSQIALVDAATGEITELSRLPGNTEYDVDAGTVLAFSWSPDAKTLAFSLRHPELEPKFDGVWMIDLTTGYLRAQLNIMVAQTALQTIAPNATIFAIGPILWSPSGIMVWIGDPGSYEGLEWCFWLDQTTGTLEAIEAPMPDNLTEASFMQAVWSPDGTKLLLATQHHEPLPGEEAVSLDPADDRAQVSLRLLDPTTGESTLLGYLPFRPVFPFTAAWAPDNNIIIDGYHLTLAE
jgi:hypothetical protein